MVRVSEDEDGVAVSEFELDEVAEVSFSLSSPASRTMSRALIISASRS